MAINTSILLFAIPSGGAPAILAVPAAIGLGAGGWTWWSRRKEREAEGMIQLYAWRWFGERGYYIYPGGAYGLKPEANKASH